MKKRIKAILAKFSGKAAFHAASLMMFVAAIAVNLCVQPIWHFEPEMPDCLKRELSE